MHLQNASLLCRNLYEKIKEAFCQNAFKTLHGIIGRQIASSYWLNEHKIHQNPNRFLDICANKA